MLSKEQITQLKQQIIEQINSNFPEEKKAESIKKLNSMNDEEFEQFLIQNNLIHQQEEKDCIFCSILEGKIPTNKFAETEHAIATLDINPISKAHSIIIPKIHSEKAPQQAFQLAEIIKQRIKKIFNPKKIEIYTSNFFGHEIINVLPIYKNETKNSKRQKVSQEELQKIQKQLIEFKEEKKEKPKKKKIISDKTHWLPKRIP